MNYLVDDLHTWDQAYGAWGCCGCPHTGSHGTEYGGLVDTIRGWFSREGGDGLLARIRARRAQRRAQGLLEDADWTAFVAAEDRTAPTRSTAEYLEQTEDIQPTQTFWQRLRSRWQDREPVEAGTREEWLATAATLAPALLMARQGGAGLTPGAGLDADLMAQLQAETEAEEEKKRMRNLLLIGGGVVLVGVIAITAGQRRRP